MSVLTELPPPPPFLLDGAALFLDFDGTLVELAERPDAIRLAPDLHCLLDRVQHRLRGRLAIISGRSLSDLQRHLQLPGIGYSGSHGLELQLADGTRLPLSLPIGLDHVREQVHAFAAGHDGLLVEEKPAGIALHYRLAPHQADRAAAFMAALADREGWALQRGNQVVELRPEGATKGDALRAFMSENGFRSTRPIFVGDDFTDEHGFQAASELGGAGILVGPSRETAARFRLDSVAAVADWLRAGA